MSKNLLTVTSLNLAVASVLLTIANSSHQEPEYNVDSQNVCITPGCVRAAAALLENMDKAVDPCTNFHEYACGAFNKREPGDVMITEAAENERKVSAVFDAENPDAGAYSVSMLLTNSTCCRCFNLAMGNPNLMAILTSMTTAEVLPFVKKEIERKGVITIWLDDYGLRLESREEFVDRLKNDLNITADLLGTSVKWGDADVQRQFEELVDFQMKVDEIGEAAETLEPIKNVTFGQIQAFTSPIIDFRKLIGPHLRRVDLDALGDEMPVVMQQVPVQVLKELIPLFDKTKEELLRNFFLLAWAKKMRMAVETLNGGNCFKWTVASYQYVVDHAFLARYRDPADVLAGKEVMKKIQKAYVDVVNENGWLGPETKQYLIGMVETAQPLFGHTAEMSNATMIDELYDRGYGANLTAFVDVLFNGRSELTIGRPLMPAPQMVGRLLEDNTVELGSFFFAPPYFSRDWPLERRFAGLGTTKCLADKFGAIVYANEWLNFSIQHHGNFSLREATADLNGFKVGFRAFLNEKKRLFDNEPPRWPGFTKYTPEQMFFLSGAQMYCGRLRGPATPNDMQFNDPHPQPIYRLNFAYQNLAPFANAFRCPLDSPMNPKKKCGLWRHRMLL
ncbi:unnamed protein product, partial [Mesorhabditis spiculigera]